MSTGLVDLEGWKSLEFTDSSSGSGIAAKASQLVDALRDATSRPGDLFGMSATLYEEANNRDALFMVAYLTHMRNAGMATSIRPETGDYSPTVREMIARLEEIGKQCAMGNWDGDDAAAISADSVEYAKMLTRFLGGVLGFRSLQSAVELSIHPEPDGFINFGWYKANDHFFEISIGGDKILHCAGRLGFVPFSDKTPLAYPIAPGIIDRIMGFYL
jgi:hypothetical protein